MDLLRDWLANNDVWVTLHQTVVNVLKRCAALGFGGTLRAQVMSNEMAEEYPDAAIESLRRAIQDYDAINDVQAINTLQRSIAVTQDDVGVGIRLAREVKTTIDRIRQKDAIGARIVLLASLLQLHHTDLAVRHRAWAGGTAPDADVSRILALAVKRLQSPEDVAAFWDELTANDYDLLARFLQVQTTDVRKTLQAYINAATETLFVEPANN